ncbi:hypothetical protein CR513_42910, partial [Mucuna pruriens]
MLASPQSSLSRNKYRRKEQASTRSTFRISKAGKGCPSSGDHDPKVESILPKQLDSRPNQPPHQVLRKPDLAT